MLEGVALFELAGPFGAVAAAFAFEGDEAFANWVFGVASIGFDALEPSAVDRPTRVMSEIPEIVDFLNSVLLGK